MDCCNYMQYRHPYYGPQFYENNLYNRDYYGHPYQSYYANSHYYSQQWPCAASFSDYVYNPKEARIRKAMREASRERAVGAAPIPSPRGGRRSQSWTSTPEEQLMMAPSPDLGGPLCGSSIFPGPPVSSAVGQFMQPLNNYTKLVHVLPTSGWLQDSPTYLQHNPMAELQQHQANMWQQYQEPMRSCTGPTYMLNSQINLYQEVNPTDVLPQKKCKSEVVDAYPSNSSSVIPIETTPSPPQPPPPPPPASVSKSDSDKVVKNEKIEENNKETTTTVDDAQTLVDSTNIEQSETFLPVFQETVVVQNPFDKDDDMKLKKDSNTPTKNPNQDPEQTTPYCSTEDEFSLSTISSSSNASYLDNSLGLVLTPPECPLAEPIPSDSTAHTSRPLNFKTYGNCEFCCRSSSSGSVESKSENVDNCNYLTFPFTTPMFHDPCNLDMLLMDNCNPNLIYTDVGVIPMYDNLDVEQLLHNSSANPRNFGCTMSGSKWELSENRDNGTKNVNK